MKTKPFRYSIFWMITILAIVLWPSFNTPAFAVNQDNNLRGLPVDEIQGTIGVQGTIEHGVLDLEVERNDLTSVQGPAGTDVTFTPSFELNGDIFFQPLGGRGRAFVNGDMPLLETEVNPFIAALRANGLEWQAFHQHFPSTPQIWFVHFRGKGSALDLATAVKAALNTTAIQFPQAPPTNPTTPLDKDRLASILNGNASVGSDGVVTVWVYRRNPVFINGILVNPQANISTNIQFNPLNDDGTSAAVVPDFSMEAKEIDCVVDKMLALNWYQGCLYNQETDEHPQLYFDHMIKVGDPYTLAQEIRNALDCTRSR